MDRIPVYHCRHAAKFPAKEIITRPDLNNAVVFSLLHMHIQARLSGYSSPQGRSYPVIGPGVRRTISRLATFGSLFS